ncbi:hypothetical protein J6590_021368 [Homalodisca vitripennis]|nr:hypothetical protein J6590_021368 [Homalodisca vitripennis]
MTRPSDSQVTSDDLSDMKRTISWLTAGADSVATGRRVTSAVQGGQRCNYESYNPGTTDNNGLHRPIKTVPPHTRCTRLQFKVRMESDKFGETATVQLEISQQCRRFGCRVSKVPVLGTLLTAASVLFPSVPGTSPVFVFLTGLNW